jgi:hypothetical protein
MISSEVQRTLVKSPPELWAEISDPESLARHLGEFGEIRITRVQPEQKVEWEADDASGTVVIKPSGWGTKVKLTVTREHAVAAGGSTAQSDGEPDRELAPAHEPAQDVERAQDVTPAHAHEPAHDVELEHDAADSAVLARELQDIPEPNGELEADSDDDPPLATGATPEPGSQAEAAEDETELDEPADTHAHAEPVAQPEPEPEPEPRRGFFARLFGRRRTRVEEPGAPESSREELPEPIASEPTDDEPLAASSVDAPERDFDFLDEPTPADEPASSAAVDEPAEIAAQPLGELAPGTGAQTTEQTTSASEDLAVTSSEQAALDEPPSQAKLAEELATEEVTAVLTGVLDRLGAAHHRPFSRA